MSSRSPLEHPELLDAIESASGRTLAAVLTHLTGDPDVIADWRDHDALVDMAMRILPPFVGEPDPSDAPSDEVLQAAMDHAAGEPMLPRYRPLVLEQMGFGPRAQVEPLNPPPGFTAVIIGAGVTGLAIAAHFCRLGFEDFVIIERNPDAGGTWTENRYPGCRVDTPSVLYAYSTDPDPGWPDHFSFQPVVRDYLHGVANGLKEHIRYETEVNRMTWDEESASWTLDLRHGSDTETLTAHAVVGATGFLSVPSVPKLAGIESFSGPTMHSKEWPGEIDLTGQRVAVIGTGASANQIVPALAPIAEHLTVYQRSPHWVTPHPYYGRRLDGIERWLFDNIPTYMRWFRFVQFWTVGDRNQPLMRIDDAWEHKERSVNAGNDRVRTQLVNYIESETKSKPELRPLVTPDYPPYAKRMIVDNGWYRALCRDNVELVTSPIVGVLEHGIESSDGVRQFDAIVYATGFQTNRVLWPIEIFGVGGKPMRPALDSDPRGYLGFAFAGCPNLFVTTGPNSIPVHGGAITFLAECQASYIAECLRGMFTAGAERIEIRPEALDDFVDEMHRINSGFVWSIDGVDNWFKGSVGSTSLVLPWSNLELWEEAKSPDLTVYDFR